MLKEIRLINYKALRCERIELEALTVFICPNGSGKSRIASALHALFTIIMLGLSAIFSVVTKSLESTGLCH
jgi:predicted ATPase